MAEKKQKYEVVHDRQYFMVEKKLQKVPKGSTIMLTEKMAESLGSKVMKFGGKPSVTVGSDDDDTKAAAAKAKAEADAAAKAEEEAKAAANK